MKTTKPHSLSLRIARAGAIGLLALLAAGEEARADACSPVAAVFSGDPCDPITGPYPMIPGLPLVLPADGVTGDWKSGLPSVNTGFSGDVDLAVRVGDHAAATVVPAPAGSAMNPGFVTNEAGGGGALQGNSIEFTVLVTDGPGMEPYGSVLTGTELDARPVAVFAYADLDNDGTIGPNSSDGAADNSIEKQEAISHVGRQVGQLADGRFTNLLAVRVGAPASIGGLKIGLAAGGYTGDDPDLLWSNGTPMFTSWPFFPPLDPLQIVFLDEPNPPDPDGPNILFYQTSKFFLPPPATPNLVDAFAMPLDGSNVSTDQFVSVSGAVTGARFYRDVSAANYSPSSLLTARVAPTADGMSRTLVQPLTDLVVERGDVVVVRLLPIDSLGNVADPPMGGFSVKIAVTGGLHIVSPDLNSDSSFEILSLDDAKGINVTLTTSNVNQLAALTAYEPPPNNAVSYDQLVVSVTDEGEDLDSDDDGIADDGDGSGLVGDHPCTAGEAAAGVPCDDNCPFAVNPSQVDSDEDGQGNCCDATCVLDDEAATCLECPASLARFSARPTRVRSTILPRGGLQPDRLKVLAMLTTGEGQEIAPDAEDVVISLVLGDRIHYRTILPGVFTLKNSRPTYVYKDKTGSIDGVIKAIIRAGSSGYRLRLVAKGVGLVDTAPAEVLPNGLVFAATINDDAFVRHLGCASSLKSVRCSSAD